MKNIPFEGWVPQSTWEEEESEKTEVEISGTGSYTNPISFCKWDHSLHVLSGRNIKQCFLSVMYLTEGVNRASVWNYQCHGSASLRVLWKRAKGVHWMWELCCTLYGKAHVYLFLCKMESLLPDEPSLLCQKSFIMQTTTFCTPCSTETTFKPHVYERALHPQSCDVHWAHIVK